MMKTIYSIIFFAIFTKVCAQQPIDTLIIPKKYALSTKLPLTIGSGKTLIINETDTLHIVNQGRFDNCQMLKKVIDNQDIKENTSYIISNYNRILKENDLLFDQLEKKCREQGGLYQKTIKELKTSLNETDRTLDLSQKSLENANNSIELGLKQISASQKKQFWRNFGLIGGGVSIGLITGLLIAN